MGVQHVPSKRKENLNFPGISQTILQKQGFPFLFLCHLSLQLWPQQEESKTFWFFGRGVLFRIPVCLVTEMFFHRNLCLFSHRIEHFVFMEVHPTACLPWSVK